MTVGAFSELDWTRLDVWGVVTGRGVAVVHLDHRVACAQWLRERGYRILELDFAGGSGPAVGAMGQMFHWEEEFGYALSEDSRNLDALRDGFRFALAPGERCVLELLNTELAAVADVEWFSGLLSIASEHSLHQLALGARFFTVVVLRPSTHLVGMQYDRACVPVPFGRFASPSSLAPSGDAG